MFDDYDYDYDYDEDMLCDRDYCVSCAANYERLQAAKTMLLDDDIQDCEQIDDILDMLNITSFCEGCVSCANLQEQIYDDFESVVDFTCKEKILEIFEKIA